MKIASIIAILSSVGIFALLKAQSQPEGKVTLRVVDESGNPIPQAEVKAGFGLPYNGWVERPKSYGKQITTDAGGVAELEGETTGRIGFSVRLEGYYLSRDEIYFMEKKSDKWQPWNPTRDLVIKRIINPIPMYAKRMHRFKVPAFDTPLGFDMEAGDWVSPHGKGTTADFFYTKHVSETSSWDSELMIMISFPNKGDGIQPFAARKNTGSVFISPRNAPEAGYLPGHKSFQIRKKDRKTEGNFGSSSDRFFFLRTRTVLNEDGTVKSALYSKFYGELNQFDYFLNPTPNDRNMEFDTARNLIQGLDSLQRPHGP